MEVGGLDHLDVPDNVERVLTQEEVLDRLEPVHRVAGADARDTVVGVHTHDRRVEMPPRLRIPRSVQRRVEPKAQPVKADVDDLHDHPHAEGTLAPHSRSDRKATTTSSATSQLVLHWRQLPELRCAACRFRMTTPAAGP